MKSLIVEFSDNWADEFDVVGFRIFAEDEWNAYKTFLKEEVSWPQEMSFGTNEGIEYDSSKNYLDRMKIREISAEEEYILTSLDGYVDGYGYGIFLEINIEEYRLDLEYEKSRK